MGAYKLSELCDEDIGRIYEYGLRQAKEYILGLHNAFELLARQNFMGLDASELKPELLRFTFESDMIFYLTTDYGSFIIRVLHQSMDYHRHISR